MASQDTAISVTAMPTISGWPQKSVRWPQSKMIPSSLNFLEIVVFES